MFFLHPGGTIHRDEGPGYILHRLQEATRAKLKTTIPIPGSHTGVPCTRSFAIYLVYGDPPDQFSPVELLSDWEPESAKLCRVAKLRQVIYGFEFCAVFLE